jgi:hypothetical protein
MSFRAKRSEVEQSLARIRENVRLLACRITLKEKIHRETSAARYGFAFASMSTAGIHYIMPIASHRPPSVAFDTRVLGLNAVSFPYAGGELLREPGAEIEVKRQQTEDKSTPGGFWARDWLASAAIA